MDIAIDPYTDEHFHIGWRSNVTVDICNWIKLQNWLKMPSEMCITYLQDSHAVIGVTLVVQIFAHHLTHSKNLET